MASLLPSLVDPYFPKIFREKKWDDTVQTTCARRVQPIVKANIARETHVMTDESNTYSGLDKLFDKHGVVDHSRKEYSYTDRLNGVKIGINGKATTAFSSAG